MAGGTATRSWLFYAALGNPLFTKAYGLIRGQLHGLGVLTREDFGANEIIPGLWLGDIYDAHNLVELRRRRIGSVLTCVRGVEPSFPEKLRYLSLDAMDVSEQDMAQYFESTNAFIHGVLSDETCGVDLTSAAHGVMRGNTSSISGNETQVNEGEHAAAGANGNGKEEGEGRAVLVHCMQGVSRSTTVVLAYLMRHQGMRLEEALALAKEKRPRVQPNQGFLDQLKRYEEVIGHYGK